MLAAKMKPGVDIDPGQITGTPSVWVFAVTTFDESRGKHDGYVFFVNVQGDVWAMPGSTEVWEKERRLRAALIEGCVVRYHSSLDDGVDQFEVSYEGSAFYVVMDNEYLFRIDGAPDSMLRPLLRPAETDTGRRRPRRKLR